MWKTGTVHGKHVQIHYKVCTTYMPKNTKKRQCPNPCWMDTHQTNAINVLYVKKIHQNILETLWQWKTTLQPCLRNKQKIFKSAKTLAKKQKECGETHAKKHATCWTLKIPQQQSQTCHGNAAGTKTHTPKKKKGRKKQTHKIHTRNLAEREHMSTWCIQENTK